jgi:hypothetical protein
VHPYLQNLLLTAHPLLHESVVASEYLVAAAGYGKCLTKPLRAAASSHTGPSNLKRSCKLGMLRNDVQLTLPALIQVSLIQLTPLFDGYVSGFEEVLIEPQFAMVGILLAFAAVHSGLAFLRPYGGAPPLRCAAAINDGEVPIYYTSLTVVKCLFITHL